MEENSTNGRKSQKGTSNKNRGRSRRNRGRRPQSNAPKLPPEVCAICGKPIDLISQAIGGPGKEDLSHFDCMLSSLQESERLEENQKVSYIGNGTFAVIEFSGKNQSGSFSVVRRIHSESKESSEHVKKVVDRHKQAIYPARDRKQA